jgi:4-carboxymuconolactone decarboxylase
MSKTPIPNERDNIRATAPKLIELTEKVIYGDVWEREELSKRDRSLITIAALVAMGRGRQLVGHMGRALDNGVTHDEIIETITHQPSIPAGLRP